MIDCDTLIRLIMVRNVFANFSDPKGKYTNCREVLTELGLRNVSDQDCENVRYVCSVVSRRAAHLVSAGIATLLNKMGENDVTVGIDGSVYRYHPHFHDLMVAKISELQSYKVRPTLEDSSRIANDV